MKRIVVALTVIVVTAMSAAAQGPADPGSPLQLLSKEKVQKELGLQGEQAATLGKLAAQVRADPSKAADAIKTLNKTIKLSQMKRLKEISYQVRGGAAVGDGDVMKVLGLSDKQKADIRSIWTNSEKDLQMMLAVARFRSPQARAKFIGDHRKRAGERMLAVLSEDQKKQFDKLKGKPFDTSGLDME